MSNNIIMLLGISLENLASHPFLLSLNERSVIEQIRDRMYIQFPSAGLVLMTSLDKKVMAVQVYSAGYRNSKGFKGVLPEGILFSSSRGSVTNNLGSPSASGGGVVLPVFGKAPLWDRYDRDQYSLHIQYYVEDDSSISLLTVMRRDNCCTMGRDS